MLFKVKEIDFIQVMFRPESFNTVYYLRKSMTSICNLSSITTCAASCAKNKIKA